MKQLNCVDPIYGIDYAPGHVLFTRTDGSFISKGIVWFQDQFEASDFDPSHVMLVVDEHTVTEAVSQGIKETNIHEYFDNEKVQVLCRKPEGLTDQIAQELIAYSKTMIGMPYDFTGLLLGYPLMITLGLAKYIKFLRKLPLPLHFPGSRVCSGYVSDIFKHHDAYKAVRLLKDWHITRIVPSMLLNEFPFSQYTFKKKENRDFYVVNRGLLF